MSELTSKQEAFVSYYLGEANFNGSLAAKMAGYSSPVQSAHENLSKPYVAEKVRAHLDSLRVRESV